MCATHVSTAHLSTAQQVGDLFADGTNSGIIEAMESLNDVLKAFGRNEFASRSVDPTLVRECQESEGGLPYTEFSRARTREAIDRLMRGECKAAGGAVPGVLRERADGKE